MQYKWHSKSGGNAAVKPAEGEATPAAEAAPSVPSAAEELSVFWASVEEKGKTEEEAKAKLNKRVLSERISAERACLSNHENLSGCIAAKYSSLSPSVSTLSFSAKKAVEEAIKTDCDKQQGKCSGSSVGEAKCQELKAEAEPTEAAAGKDTKKKK